MRIDAFAHALTPELRRRGLELRKSPSELALWDKLTALVDLDERWETMDGNGIDLQIVTTAGPPLESIFGDDDAMELAAIANDTIAELAARHPDRLRGTATMPLVDVEWALAELRRSVDELGLVGVLLYSSVRGRPLDSPDLEPFFSEVERLGIPIWLHPERAPQRPDYPGEDRSKYGLNLVLGWPFETSLAMARLVFSGTMLRHPGLRVIAHHAGAMIPFFARRIEMHYPHDGDRQSISDEVPLPEVPYLEQFRRFYVDTVTQGSVSSLMSTYDMYGAEHMLLGSDFPFGPQEGRRFAEVAIEAVEQMPIQEAEKEMIRSSNVARLLGDRLS